MYYITERKKAAMWPVAENVHVVPTHHSHCKQQWTIPIFCRGWKHSPKYWKRFQRTKFLQGHGALSPTTMATGSISGTVQHLKVYFLAFFCPTSVSQELLIDPACFQVTLLGWFSQFFWTQGLTSVLKLSCSFSARSSVFGLLEQVEVFWNLHDESVLDQCLSFL